MGETSQSVGDSKIVKAIVSSSSKRKEFGGMILGLRLMAGGGNWRPFGHVFQWFFVISSRWCLTHHKDAQCFV
jgi:hypothetical protein